MSDYPPPPSGPPPGYQQYGYGYGAGVPVVYAGFWIRFAAALLDGLILAIPLAILGAILESSGTFGYSVGYSPSYSPLLNLINTAVGVLYYGLLEGGPTGQTIGKRACSIRVVDQDTGQPGVGPGRGIGRYFARILSSIPLGLGYFWMLWDSKKQTWHDKLARTVVAKV
jgi:uncharacterized RDD family membrane protein YckC